MTIWRHLFLNYLFKIPFLERDDIDSLPYVVTATLLTLPVSLHEDVLDVLCWHLLPFTMNTAERPSTVDNCVLPGKNVSCRKQMNDYNPRLTERVNSDFSSFMLNASSQFCKVSIINKNIFHSKTEVTWLENCCFKCWNYFSKRKLWQHIEIRLKGHF